MKLFGDVLGIVPSRSHVSGFFRLNKDDEYYSLLVEVFHMLSDNYDFYCNHVALKLIYLSQIYYIGYDGNEISIGSECFTLQREDSREFIPLNKLITQLLREAKKRLN